MTAPTPNIIPIYTSRGDTEAFLAYPYLFNRQGEWIGWVTPQREVYSVLGYYVGMLSKDPRILRKRADEGRAPIKPPAAPQRIRIPSHSPLPKMMSELSYEMIDVLGDEPELLHTRDRGELMQDLD